MPGLTIATSNASAPAQRTATTSSSMAPPALPPLTTSVPRTSTPEPPPISPITPTLGPTQLPEPASTGVLPTTATTTTTSSTTSSTGNLPRARSARDNKRNSSNNSSIPTANTAVNPPVPDFAQGRTLYTHTQAAQVGAVPPPAAPIAFDDNPDVLALKSAISILQLQRAKATADMRTLRQAKTEALADPAAFIADLQAGRVQQEGDLRFQQDDSDSESGSSSSKDSGAQARPDGASRDDAQGGVEAAQSSKDKGKGKSQRGPSKKAWHKLPKAQNVVRAPPINWAQYGVIGESLDKLHAEQVAAPSQGVPAVLGAGGTFEFKAGEFPTGEQRRLVGVAAPYAPGKDKIDRTRKR